MIFKMTRSHLLLLVLLVSSMFFVLVSKPANAFDITESADEYLTKLHIYGYISVRYEKVFQEPSLVDGLTVKEDVPGEWTFEHFNIMLQNQLSKHFKVYANLDGGGFEGVEVRNAWESCPFRIISMFE